MDIHETHQMNDREIDGKTYKVCSECGATDVQTNVLVMEAPCMGPAPSLKVIDDGEVIAIQWSFPEGGVKSSDFPQPLVTVDYALDGRPIQLVLVGPRARELREAIKSVPKPKSKPHWSRDPNAKPPTSTSVFRYGRWIDPEAPCICGSGGYPDPCPRHDPGRVGS